MADRPATKPQASPREATDDDGGGKRRKVRTKQCIHCLMPCTILHRVRIAERGHWVSVCDICWGHRCDGNPHYAYGGLWNAGRLTQPGEQKATRPRTPRKGGSGPKKPKHAGPTRPPA